MDFTEPNLNRIQLNLDLETETGRKALRALADALAPSTASTPAPIPPVGFFPGETPVGTAEVGETLVEEQAAQEAPPATEAAKPRRRRTKAEKEEDERNGKDGEYQRLAKEMPDSSVDEIRAVLYGPVADPAVTPAQEGTTVGPEVGDGSDEPDWEPSWDAPQGEVPVQAPPAADDEWAPNW